MECNLSCADALRMRQENETYDSNPFDAEARHKPALKGADKDRWPAAEPASKRLKAAVETA